MSWRTESRRQIYEVLPQLYCTLKDPLMSKPYQRVLGGPSLPNLVRSNRSNRCAEIYELLSNRLAVNSEPSEPR